MSFQVQLSFSTSLNHAGGSLFLLWMPMQRISISNSSYFEMIPVNSASGSGSSLAITLSKSDLSIDSKSGFNLNQVRTVIGDITIQSPGSFPGGRLSLLLKSNGIFSGCSVIVFVSSCTNSLIILFS